MDKDVSWFPRDVFVLFCPKDEEDRVMKKLEIIIKPEKLEEAKEITEECKTEGVMLSDIIKVWESKGIHKNVQGNKIQGQPIPRSTN